MAIKEKIGIVVSTKMEKTIIIAVENKYSHPIYGKTLKKTQRFMAHDEKNICQLKILDLIVDFLTTKKRYLSALASFF